MTACRSFLNILLSALLVTGCAAVVPRSPLRLPSLPEPRRTSPPPSTRLRDLRGVIHLHATTADGTGTVETIARLAKAANLDFIIVTDQNLLQPPPDRPSDRPLVLTGTEIATTAGHLLALNIRDELSRDQPVEEIVNAIHAQGGLAIAAHPLWATTPWTRWDLPLDGLELFDFDTMLRNSPWPWRLVKALTMPNFEFWRTLTYRPAALLELWDRQLATRPLIGLASHATHAHASIGPFVLDSYQNRFRLVSTHVWVDQLTPEAIYAGLRQGHCYLAFDSVADPRPFAFFMRAGNTTALMGEHLRWQSGVIAAVHLPRWGTGTLYRNGMAVGTARGFQLQWPLKQPGIYRLEVTRGGRPWIITNPIYVETGS